MMRFTIATTLVLFGSQLAWAELPKVPQNEAWRTKRPKAGPQPTPVLPTFVRAKLDNGLTILVSTEDSLPLVSFRLVSRGGAALDPAGKAGLGAITYAMLQEGAGDLDFLAFSDRVADLGANFGASSGRDQGGVAVSGLARHAEAMLDLLAAAALRPKMSPNAFKRRQAQTLASLQRRRGSPHGLAMEAVPALIYGAEHPYGHSPSGTIQTVSSLKLEDIVAHHKRLLVPQHSALIATGAITLEEATEMAKARFGAWPKSDEPRAPIPKVQAKERTKLVILHKDNAPQTSVFLGRPLFGRGHPDEEPTKVLNGVLGGNFSARLNMKIREEKGYAYGAYSQTAFRDQVGVLIAVADIRQDVTAPGLTTMIGEIKGLVDNPPKPDEVDLAKASVIRALPGSLDTTQAIASAASSLFVYDLPLDHYSKIGARYAAISLDAVRRAAQTYMSPKTMQILLVGDSNAILEPLKAAGFTEIEVRKNP